MKSKSASKPRVKQLITAVLSKMETLGVTRQGLAKKFKVHPNVMSRCLNGVTRPNGELTLKMIEWVKGRETGDFLGMPQTLIEKAKLSSAKTLSRVRGAKGKS